MPKETFIIQFYIYIYLYNLIYNCVLTLRPDILNHSFFMVLKEIHFNLLITHLSPGSFLNSTYIVIGYYIYFIYIANNTFCSCFLFLWLSVPEKSIKINIQWNIEVDCIKGHRRIHSL